MARVIAFDALVRLLRQSDKRIYVKLQDFKKPWIANYGEIPKFINKADNDPWDVIIPGYPRLETTKSFRIKELLGVYKLPNGNHKLIIDIYDELYQDKARIRSDVNKFKKKYEERTKLLGNIIYF
jgi:inorganic pyrophosphatase